MIKLFDFRFSFKNFIANSTVLISMILSFFTFFLLVSVVFIMPKSAEEAIIQNEIDASNGYEVVLQTDNNSETRFFPIDNIENADRYNMYINDSASFFKSSVIIVNESKNRIANFYASDIDNIKKMINIESTEINNKEVIISKSTASKYNYKKNELISLNIGNDIDEYEIIEIVEDHSFIKEDVLVFNKMAVSDILDVEYLLIKDMANTVYFSLNEGVSIDDAIIYIKDDLLVNVLIPYLDIPLLDLNLNVDQTFDEQTVAVKISSYRVSISIISVLIICLLFLLINSLIARSVKSRQKDLEIISLLGGSKWYFIKIHFIEMIIYILLALFITVLVIPVLFTLFLQTIFSGSRYTLNIEVIKTFFLALLFLILIIGYNYYKIFAKIKTIYIKKIYILIFDILLMLITMGLKTFINNNFLTIFMFFSIAIFLGLLLEYMLYWVSYLFRKQKSVFGFVNARYIAKSKNYLYSVRLLLACFISIIFVIIINSYISNQLTKTSDYFSFDYIVYNINRNIDIEEIEISEENIAVNIYSNLKINEYSEINNAYSLDYEDYELYFNHPFSIETLGKMKSTDEGYIILPVRFKFLYDMKIGDKIDISLNTKYQDISFEVVDFLDHDYNFFCFTNIMNLDELKEAGVSDFSANSYLVKSSNPDFSSNIYQIVDKDAFLDRVVSDYEMVTKFMIYLTIVIIGLMVFVVISNSILLFEELSNDYRKISLIGMSKRDIRKTLYMEFVLVFFVIFFLTMISIFILTYYLEDLVLVMGSYSHFYVLPNNISLGVVVCFITFVISQSIYIYKLNRLNIIKTLNIE